MDGRTRHGSTELANQTGRSSQCNYDWFARWLAACAGKSKLAACAYKKYREGMNEAHHFKVVVVLLQRRNNVRP